MEQLLSFLGIFILFPWLAAVLGVLLLGLGFRRARRAAITAGLIWVLYAVYETGMKQRWWCSGECNIRIDLLLVYPMLLVLTVVGMVSLLRTGRGHSLG